MSPDPIRPPVLVPGDTVRVVSPSGPPTRERVAAGVALLESWGLRVEFAPHAFDRHGYLAGTDEDRVADLNAALRDERVRGVICSRGGYGTTRIIDRVDFAAARRDPKPVTGYSDITALFQGLYIHSGISAVHGPVLTTFATDHDPGTVESFRRALMSDEPLIVTARDTEETARLTTGDTTVTGRLLGGNLTLVADAIGTGTLPDLTGAIVYLEEIDEAPYRADRILTQLLRSGALDTVSGFALGQFTSCTDPDGDRTIVDVLHDRLGGLGVPILGGLPFGHGDNPRTLPYGTTAALDPVAGVLTAVAPLRGRA